MRFVAGRGAAAKSHREDAAGCGHRDRAVAGRDAVTELLLARALLQNSIGEQPAAERRAVQSSGQRRAAAGALNNHGRCNI